MNRRTYLRNGAALGIGVMAGCTQPIQDSDGDGVPDSEDFAPRDPQIQRAVDRLRQPSNPLIYQREEERSDSGNRLDAELRENMISVEETDIPSHIPYIRAYGVDSVIVNLERVGQFVEQQSDTPFSTSVKALSLGVTVDDGELFGIGESEPFDLANGKPDTTISVEWSRLPFDTELYYFITLVPSETDIQTVTGDEGVYLHETDHFTVNQATGIERTPYSEHQPAVRTNSYERLPVEGLYELHFLGETNGQDWDVVFHMYKSSYVEKHSIPRTRESLEDRARYVRDALTTGIADSLGESLYETALDLGFTSRAEQLEFVIDFVQSLPYADDEVGTGYDDYSKYVQETIVDASGDCEDTSILLASIIQSDVFNLDAALIVPPNHMGVGVAGRDIQGTSFSLGERDYYYVETTGENWRVGQLPRIYDGEDVSIIQV